MWDAKAWFEQPLPGLNVTVGAKVIKAYQPLESLKIELGFPAKHYQQELLQAIQPLAEKLKLDCSFKVARHKQANETPVIPNIQNIIGVMSGKGGVGKSTVAARLALALSQEGARVGLLDADLHGPSQPTLYETQDAHPVVSAEQWKPIEQFGVYTMSLGYLIKPEEAVIWRGPIISRTMEQLLRNTQWPPLDYLIVDLPPGTGDVSLTVCQKIPLTAAVLVTTPHILAIRDVERAHQMLVKLNVPTIGLVENMSYLTCMHCQQDNHLWQSYESKMWALEHHIPILGNIPFSIEIAQHSLAHQEATGLLMAQPYRAIALKMAAILSTWPREHRHLFPPIRQEFT